MEVDKKKEAKNKLNNMQAYLKIHQDNEETPSEQEDVFDEHKIASIIEKPKSKQKNDDLTIAYFSPRRQEKAQKYFPPCTFGASPRGLVASPTTALLPTNKRLLSPNRMFSPTNKKKFEHIKPKFNDTQKAVDGLRNMKLELHAKYQTKKKLE